MISCSFHSISHLKGDFFLPGDKSIAHRYLILSAITPGKTTIQNFPANKDCFQTVKAFQDLGIKIIYRFRKGISGSLTVFGRGLYGLKKPKRSIFVGDSGTTFRLLLGVLAGQKFRVRLRAGRSLSHRPMLRVTEPLRIMGAVIKSKIKIQKSKIEEYPPITIKGGDLKGIVYKMPVASSQVKSAILLAALYAQTSSRLIEPLMTRDHTERALRLFKADIKVKANTMVIRGKRELISPRHLYVPGDISSAAFFIVLAAILPKAEIRIKNVSLNPSRLGLVRVLKRMKANIRVTNYPECSYLRKLYFGIPKRHKSSHSRNQLPITNYEPTGEILVKNSQLKGTVVKKEEIPSLIDELPILMVAASVAKGKTVFEAVNELRVKETDRIKSMTDNLRRMGAQIKVVKRANLEYIIVKGVKGLRGAKVRSFGDHRTAMSIAVAGLKAKGTTLIDDIGCINKSFPDFLLVLKELTKEIIFGRITSQGDKNGEN